MGATERQARKSQTQRARTISYASNTSSDTVEDGEKVVPDDFERDVTPFDASSGTKVGSSTGGGSSSNRGSKSSSPIHKPPKVTIHHSSEPALDDEPPSSCAIYEDKWK